MRTTVNIPDELAEQAKRSTGRTSLSAAITESLTDYFRLKNRLALLDDLFDQPVPHSIKEIQRNRRKRKWSA